MSGNILYQTFDEQTVINNFTEYVEKNGGDFTQWFIGVTHFSYNNEEIKNSYKLKHNTIMNFMMDDNDVGKVFDYFKQKGMKNNSNQKFKDKDKKSVITNSTLFIYKLILQVEV